MKWGKVGDWIKDNALEGSALVGSLITGNIPGAVAAGISLVSGATGTDNAAAALSRLQSDPKALLNLKILYYKNEEKVRNHVENMERLKLEDLQHEHSETQETIRSGDNALDERIRMTRPWMVRQSWIATVWYCIGCFGVLAITGENLFSVYIAGFLSAPAYAYMGLRTGDKFAAALTKRKTK